MNRPNDPVGLSEMGEASITAIRTTVVNLPLVAAYRWVAGLYHGAAKVIVEVETSCGIVGLGEAQNWRHASLIDDEITPRLLGEPAADLRRCEAVAVPPIETMHNTEGQDIRRAYGAVEMALWDVRAKLVGLPLYKLLGGAARRRIPFTEYFASREANGDVGGEISPEDIAAYCERMIVEHGSPHFEGKVGCDDLDTDVAIVREVRRAIGPQRTLRLDANTGWRPATARRALARVAEFDVANVEDPVASLDDMARLRRSSPIPFSTHAADIAGAARLGVPDSFVLNLTTLGGIDRTRRFIAACEAMRVGFSFYSGDTGIGVAAYLHVAAADGYLSIPSQSLLRWYADDVIAGGPMQPEEGFLDVPEAPGLGVELDRTAVARLNAAFLRDGPIEQAGIDPRVGVFNHPPLY